MHNWEAILSGLVALTFSIVSPEVHIDFSAAAYIHVFLANVLATSSCGVCSISKIHALSMNLGCRNYLWAFFKKSQETGAQQNMCPYHMAASTGTTLTSPESIVPLLPSFALLRKCMSWSDPFAYAVNNLRDGPSACAVNNTLHSDRQRTERLTADKLDERGKIQQSLHTFLKDKKKSDKCGDVSPVLRIAITRDASMSKVAR